MISKLLYVVSTSFIQITTFDDPNDRHRPVGGTIGREHVQEPANGHLLVVFIESVWQQLPLQTGRVEQFQAMHYRPGRTDISHQRQVALRIQPQVQRVEELQEQVS